MIIAVALLFQVSAFPAEDTSRFVSRETMIRLYTDCDEARWPWGTVETFVTKTDSELVAGVAQRRALEAGWRTYFAQRAGDTIAVTPRDAWIYPLTIRARLLDNFNNPRADGPHEALDIFVPREGGIVRAPVSGVIVASGDDWEGGWARSRGGFHYEGGGLSRRAGNGVMLFDSGTGDYHYFAHLQRGVLVRTGDLVRAGQSLGHVGHTGNASQPGHGRHLHYAFKQAGTECNVEGVLMSVDPYQDIRAARNRLPRTATTTR
jgi:murein DD-endopeptidase MepM/ murein hydrolase activator NlpD